MLGGPWKGPTLYTQPACSDQFRVSICTSKPQPASPHNGYKSGPSLLSLSELSPPFHLLLESHTYLKGLELGSLPNRWWRHVSDPRGHRCRWGCMTWTTPNGSHLVTLGRMVGLLINLLQYMIWVFPKIGVPQNGWFIMEKNPIKMDDLGGTTIFGNIHISEKQSTNNSKWWNLLKFFKVALGDAEGTFFPFFTLVVTDWRSGRFEATEFATLPATSAFHTDSTLPTTTVLPPNTTWAQQNTNFVSTATSCKKQPTKFHLPAGNKQAN